MVPRIPRNYAVGKILAGMTWLDYNKKREVFITMIKLPREHRILRKRLCNGSFQIVTTIFGSLLYEVMYMLVVCCVSLIGTTYAVSLIVCFAFSMTRLFWILQKTTSPLALTKGGSWVVISHAQLVETK